jgi:hypothetical protein
MCRAFVILKIISSCVLLLRFFYKCRLEAFFRDQRAIEKM